MFTAVGRDPHSRLGLKNASSLPPSLLIFLSSPLFVEAGGLDSVVTANYYP